MNKEFSKLCTPAKIYFAIAVIASIVMLFSGVSFIAVFIKLIFAFIWTFVLGWLCKKGFTSVSWFLVLLPYIIIVLASLKIYHTSQEQKQMIRNLQLQGAYGQEGYAGAHASHASHTSHANSGAQRRRRRHK